MAALYSEESKSMSSATMPFVGELSDRQWLNKLESYWSTFNKKSPAIVTMLKECFSSSRHQVYTTALFLMYSTSDFRLSKTSSLSCLVISELKVWLLEHPEKKTLLTLEIQINSFRSVLNQNNATLVKTVCDVYQWNDISQQLEIEVRDLLIDQQYRQACLCVTYLKLQSHFTIRDFVLPLIFQDKMQVAEEFLDDSTEHQLETVVFLDDLLQYKPLHSKVMDLCDDLHMREIRVLHMNSKSLAKLVSRLCTKYSVPQNKCPYLTKKRKDGSLHYLLHKKYIEKSIDCENWEELVDDIVCDDRQVLDELIMSLAQYGDLQEAVKWVEKYHVPFEELPVNVQDEISTGGDNGESPVSTTNANEEENWDNTPTIQYHELILPSDCIHIVNSIDTYDLFLLNILEVEIIAFDVEWKPTMGPNSSTSISLIQMATPERVFLLDIPALTLQLKHDDWKRINEEIFSNYNLLKLGYGVSGDLSMLSKYLPGNTQIRQTCHTLLDLQDLSQKLYVKSRDIFPYLVDATNSNASGLSELVRKCLGKPLNKSQQFSNWEKRPLREAQITYAALDAYCLIEVWQMIQMEAETRNIDLEKMTVKLTKIKRPKLKGKEKSKDIQRLEVTKPCPDTTKRCILHPSPIKPHEFRVVCDTMLNGLGRQLRSCGVDSVILRDEQHHDDCLEMWEKENRIILTRGNAYNRLRGYVPEDYCYNVVTDTLAEQLHEVTNYYNVTVEKSDIFTRCTYCNGNEYILVSQKTMTQLVDRYNNTIGHLMLKMEKLKLTSDNNKKPKPKPIATDDRNWILYPEECINLETSCTWQGYRILLTGIPPGILEKQEHFYVCDSCGKCFWDGSHFQRVLDGKLKNIVKPVGGGV